MRAGWAVSILALVALAACGRRHPPKDAESKEASGGARDLGSFYGDLFAALAKRHWSKGGFVGEDVETCVLDPETAVWGVDSKMTEPGRWEAFRQRLPALRRDTYDSLWSENQRARPIAPTNKGPMKLQVLTKAEDAELFAIAKDGRLEEYWDTFHSRYSRALRVGLSAPGFSADGTQAVVYYSAGGGPLAGSGHYCLLSRKGDRWEIAEVVCVWQA